MATLRDHRKIVEELKTLGKYYLLQEDVRAEKDCRSAVRHLLYGENLSSGAKKRFASGFGGRKLFVSNDPRDDPLLKKQLVLSSVMGIGIKTSRALVHSGVGTVAALRSKYNRGEIKLNAMQIAGLTHYDDLQKRIPHNEVGAISERLRRVVSSIDPSCVFTVAGSYRRECTTSGDIDIIICGKKNTLVSLVEELQRDDCFVSRLLSGPQRTTFLWRSRESGLVRQIDLLNIAAESYWLSVLYFTGSWEFNEGMRSWAKKLGYRLNERQIIHVASGSSVVCDSEESVFRLLGVKYVAPPDREEWSPVLC